jgi:hypothetical protein
MSELKCFRSVDKYHALEPFEKTRLFEELSQQLPVIIRVPLGVNAECVGCPGSSRRQLLKMQKSAPLKTRARIGRRFTTLKVSPLEIVEGCTQKKIASERKESKRNESRRGISSWLIAFFIVGSPPKFKQSPPKANPAEKIN